MGWPGLAPQISEQAERCVEHTWLTEISGPSPAQTSGQTRDRAQLRWDKLQVTHELDEYILLGAAEVLGLLVVQQGWGHSCLISSVFILHWQFHCGAIYPYARHG